MKIEGQRLGAYLNLRVLQGHLVIRVSLFRAVFFIETGKFARTLDFEIRNPEKAVDDQCCSPATSTNHGTHLVRIGER